MKGKPQMPERPRELAELAFHDLIASEEVDFISDEGDLHIAGDDWTLVLKGDPVTDILIALEDEEGAPEEVLREAISDEAFVSMRDLNGQLEGELVSILLNSPDILARTLAEILER